MHTDEAYLHGVEAMVPPSRLEMAEMAFTRDQVSNQSVLVISVKSSDILVIESET